MSIPLGRAAVLLTLAALALGVSACGSADDTATAADAEAKAEKARLRLERCLRENGVEVKSSDGGRRTAMRVDKAKAGDAMQKCRKYQQEAFGSITPEQRQEFQDAATKFAACMRQHGVDLPDPVQGGGGPGSGPQTRRSEGAGGVRIERDSPKTQAAMKACEDKLPRGAGGIKLAGPPGAK